MLSSFQSSDAKKCDKKVCISDRDNKIKYIDYINCVVREEKQQGQKESVPLQVTADPVPVFGTMDELIQAVNQLQEVLSGVGLGLEEDGCCVELPQIVVVGSQSSGKSSVLESLVGRSFLPRGPGVVTRRPLVLQLIYCTKKELQKMSVELNAPGLEAWGVFLHRPNRRYTRFEEIREEIVEETLRVAGEHWGISAEPILLKIYSVSVNLTLVDLPGLIKVPIGDQPPDIEKQVKDLIMRYILSPHSIILAIITANTDIATSESLQLAREVDPQGTRTLAVLTKLDLMDPGTDASDVLCGRVVPVPLGIIGVLNRSKLDIQNGTTISQALTYETTFFKLRYPELSTQHGTPFLAKRLQDLLVQHIRSSMPEVSKKVAALTSHYSHQLESFGEAVADKGQLLLHIIREFFSEFCSSINGNSKEIEITELCGGARITYIFQESFGKALDSIHPLVGLSKVSIMTAMRNAAGTRSALFVPEESFELLVKRQIQRLEEPSLRCADLVQQELLNIVHNCAKACEAEARRFPIVYRRIIDICTEILQSQLPTAHDMIRELVAIQLAYLNTNHPDFVRDARDISTWVQNLQREEHFEVYAAFEESNVKLTTSNVGSTEGDFGDGGVKRAEKRAVLLPNHPPVPPINAQAADIERENKDCLVIEHLIKSYFNITRKAIQDTVPKAIMYSLVNFVMEHMQQQLVTRLYCHEMLDELFEESREVCKLRAETIEILKALGKASDILKEISDGERLA